MWFSCVELLSLLAKDKKSWFPMLVTEAKIIEVTMLYIYRLTTEMGLKVVLSLIVECDSEDSVDIANNWSSSGYT